MPTEVVLPSLGETDVDATVSRWLKAIGEVVAKDEPLLEVSTDKVDTEIPSPVSGVLLECLASEDDTVHPGDVVAIIGSPVVPLTAAAPVAPPVLPLTVAAPVTPPFTPPAAAEPVTLSFTRPAVPPPVMPPFTPPSAPVTPPAPVAPTPVTPAPVTFTSDLPSLDSVVQPLLADIDAILNRNLRPAAPPQPAPPRAERVEAEPEEPHVTPGVQAEPEESYVTPGVRHLADELGLDLDTVPGSGVGGRLRKQDLRNAAEATPDPLRGTTQTLSPSRAARAELATQTKLALTAAIDADLSGCHPHDGKYNGHLLHAIAVALKTTTELNATLLGDVVEYHAAENIGWSIDTPAGPISPVLHDASSRSVDELATALADLTTRSSSGQLEPDDLKQATFSVRDDGATGLTWATPAINRPQVAALSIGKVRQEVILVDGIPATRDIVTLTLSYDRRVVDPGAAAAFLTRVQMALNG